MGRGFRLIKVLGIQVSIDYTWFIVFVLFSWTLAYGYFPMSTPGLATGTYLFMGMFATVLLFACVLIHEISHSYTANKLGMDIKEITLFIFGGVAQLTKEPDEPLDELKIAAAGPIASAILAGVFWAGSLFINQAINPITYSLVSFLALINAVLLIFNMIPGFPLDGGRVFRALWWYKTGDLRKSTKVASNIGKGFALFLIITGILQILVGNFTGGLWSVLIGIFLQQAAESGYQQMLMKRALEGVSVKDLMSRQVVAIDENATVTDAVDQYFFKYHYASFPVKSDGRVTGIITMGNIRNIEKDRWNETPVKDIMHSLHPEDSLSPSDSALDALTRLMSDHIGRLLVIEGGKLVGIVTRGDILKTMHFRSELKH